METFYAGVLSVVNVALTVCNPGVQYSTPDPQSRYWVEATPAGFSIKTSETVISDLPFTWMAQE